MPVSKFQAGELKKLAEEAIPAWAYAMAHEKSETTQIDFSINLDQGLPPKFIVRDYRPQVDKESVTKLFTSTN